MLLCLKLCQQNVPKPIYHPFRVRSLLHGQWLFSDEITNPFAIEITNQFTVPICCTLMNIDRALARPKYMEAQNDQSK